MTVRQVVVLGCFLASAAGAWGFVIFTVLSHRPGTLALLN